MAKKKHRKKHQFKHSEAASSPAVSQPPAAQASTPVAPVANAKPAKPTLVVGADFNYVRRDLLKVGVLASGFIIGELALWYLVNHSSFGPALYRLVKL